VAFELFNEASYAIDRKPVVLANSDQDRALYPFPQPGALEHVGHLWLAK
jgi:hypothetical protein